MDWDQASEEQPCLALSYFLSFFLLSNPLFLLREQELKVLQARRSLEEALMADGLARAAESARDMEGKAA